MTQILAEQPQSQRTKEGLLAQILYLATVVNFQTNRCVFVDLSGHVETLRISVRESKEVYQIELAKSEITLKPMEYVKQDKELLEKWNQKLLDQLTNTRDTLQTFVEAGNVSETFIHECETVTKTVTYTF